MILNISGMRGLTLQPSKRQARYFHYGINKKIMKYAHVYALFLVFVFHTSCGQNQTDVPQDNISKGHYSESQLKEADTSKVPMSMVRNVKQDRNGNILIASFRGVFRYDGKSFTNLTSTISSPSFWDVLEDRKGNLWFASRDSGVYYYPSASLRAGGKSFQHFTTKDGLASNTALHIYEDRAGNIWFGASRYDPSASLRAGGISFRTFTTKDGFPSNDIRLILEDKTGKLWFGTGGNILIYDGKTFTTPTNKDGKAFKNVVCIIEDKKGNIWLGGNDGLWRYDGSTFTNFTKKFVGNIYEDKKGNIWTSSESARDKSWALSRYDEKSLSNIEPTVTEIKSGENMFFGILEADDGSIWFGTLNGVYRYDGKTITDFKSKDDRK
jgi:ligand-binding sensor domain-containing protein